MRTSVRVGLTSIGLLTLLLAGCSAFPTEGATRVSPDPSASASGGGESSEPVEETETLPPADLTFAAGADLAQGEWIAGWNDQLMATDSRFTVSSPDDGNGSWAYLDAQSQCVVSFYQGAITDLELGADDRESTDNMLAAVLGELIPGVTAADVAANAVDDAVAQSVQAGTVDVRVVIGTTADGGTWGDFGRTFGTLGTSLFVNVECPSGQDASTEISALFDQYLAVVVSSTSTE